MISITYDKRTKLFSLEDETRVFAKKDKNKNNDGYFYRVTDNSQWNELRNDRNKKSQWDSAKNNKNKQKQLLDQWNYSYEEKSSNKGNDNKGNNNNNSDDGSNYYTKKSPRVYAFEKLLLKNLNELKGQGRVIDWKKLGDNYAVETPNDIWLNIYITADGTYIITKLDTGDGGYFGKNRRFNAIVAGPKELRDIISSARELEDASLLKKFKYRFISWLFDTPI